MTLTLAALAIALPLAADGIPPRPEQLKYPPLTFTPPTADTFRSTLADGTPVFMAPSHEFPLINMVIVARGGTNLEPADKVGLAEITASMIRRGGTASMGADEVDETLDFMATKAGVGVRGSTMTASLNCLSRNFPQSLGVLVDMLRNPAFDGEKLKLEIAEAIEGLKQRNDDAGSIAGREWASLQWGDSHYLGRQPVESGIRSVSAADMSALTAQVFHPGNFMISVTGDFDPAQMKAELEKAFAGWAPGAANADPTPPTHTLKPGVYFAQKDIPQGKVFLGMRSISRDDPDYFPYLIMNDILGGGGFTSRIMSRVRSDEGLAYSAGSAFRPAVYWPGEFRASFESKSPTCALAIKLILEELNRVRNEPVSADELARAKASFVETFPRTFESKDAMLGVFIDDEMTKRPAGYWQRYRDQINAVTAADVQRVAEKYLVPGNLAILVVGNWGDISKGDLTGRAKMVDLDAVYGTAVELPARDPLTLEALPAR